MRIPLDEGIRDIRFYSLSLSAFHFVSIFVAKRSQPRSIFPQKPPVNQTLQTAVFSLPFPADNTLPFTCSGLVSVATHDHTTFPLQWNIKPQHPLQWHVGAYRSTRRPQDYLIRDGHTFLRLFEAISSHLSVQGSIYTSSIKRKVLKVSINHFYNLPLHPFK